MQEVAEGIFRETRIVGQRREQSSGSLDGQEMVIVVAESLEALSAAAAKCACCRNDTAYFMFYIICIL